MGKRKVMELASFRQNLFSLACLLACITCHGAIIQKSLDVKTCQHCSLRHLPDGSTDVYCNSLKPVEVSGLLLNLVMEHCQNIPVAAGKILILRIGIDGRDKTDNIDLSSITEFHQLQTLWISKVDPSSTRGIKLKYPIHGEHLPIRTLHYNVPTKMPCQKNENGDIDLTNRDLRNFFSTLTNLEHLNLGGTVQLQGLCIQSLLQVLSESNKIALCNIRTMNLTNFQTAGYYYSITILDLTSFLLPISSMCNGRTNIEILSFSQNLLLGVVAGFYPSLPNLRVLDLTYNRIHTVHGAALLETFLHPCLTVLNIQAQGTLLGDGTDRLFIWKDYSPTISSFTSCPVTDSKNPVDALYKHDITSNGYDHSLYLTDLNQDRGVMQIFNKLAASSENSIQCLSTLLRHGVHNITRLEICTFLKCLYPSALDGLTCTLVPSLKTLMSLFDPNCLFAAKFPIGQNLQSIYADDLAAWSIYHLHDPPQHEHLCLHCSVLEEVHLGYSRQWMRSMNLKIYLKNVNFSCNEKKSSEADRETYLSLIDFTRMRTEIKEDSFIFKIPTMKHAILTQNYVSPPQRSLCHRQPHIVSLSLQNATWNQPIHPSLVQGCEHMEQIDLSYNNLADFQLQFPEPPRNGKELFVDLSFNRLRLLNQSFRSSVDEFLRKPKAKLYLSIYENHLICDCSKESLDFLHWFFKVNTSNVRIRFYDENRNDKYIFCYSNGLNGSRTLITSINLGDMVKDCHWKEWLIFEVVLTTGSVIILTLVIMTLRKNYYRIMYWMNKRRRRRHRTYTYDAYVVYSDDDRIFAHTLLLEELEGKCGLRLCIHMRDFSVGGNTFDAIGNAMRESEKIIMIISSSYLVSEYCEFECRTAVSLCTEPEEHKLVVIVMDNVPARDDMHDTMIYILDNYTVLPYPGSSICDVNGPIEPSESRRRKRLEKWFWERLRYTMVSEGGVGCCRPGGELVNDIADQGQHVFTNQQAMDERQPLLSHSNHMISQRETIRAQQNSSLERILHSS